MVLGATAKEDVAEDAAAALRGSIASSRFMLCTAALTAANPHASRLGRISGSAFTPLHPRHRMQKRRSFRLNDLSVVV